MEEKRSDGAGELVVFTEGSGEDEQWGLDAEGGSGICCFGVSTWKAFLQTGFKRGEEQYRVTLNA